MTDTPSSSEPSPEEAPTEALEPVTEETEPAETPPTESSRLDWTVVSVVALLFLSILLVPLHVYKVFGLPAHIMVVHIPVVFVPLLAIGALIIIWKDAWRKRYALALATVGLVTTAATTVASATGDAIRTTMFGLNENSQNLRGELDIIQRHAEAGEQLRMIVFVFATMLVANFVIVRLIKDETPYATIAIKLATTLFAVLAFFSVIYTAHLGAEATWKYRVNTQGVGHTPDGRVIPFANGANPLPNDQNTYQQRRFGRSLPQNGLATTSTTAPVAKSNL